MGKYIKKSKIAGANSVKDISLPTSLGFRTRSAAKNLALHRLRSHSNDLDSLNYLQLRNRRLPKLPLLANNRKQQQQQLTQCVNQCQTKNPRAKSGPAKKLEPETTTEESCGDNERISPNRSMIRDSKAIQSEIDDFFANAEQQQQRFFIQKYNFDIVSDNPLPGRYEWVKVVP
ncbi:Cyclin-dependent kinase inhibitor [Arabidopsis suecica]|uniref:Cyclin-dependent kinase inhibitor n=1 Tax=Arabidopsis suecica TaxID=45249 RepID=A0A8T2B9S6_ARASU|nr:Cyclin-dependent kinase inhibitor [Arabidopsis suecica]